MNGKALREMSTTLKALNTVVLLAESNTASTCTWFSAYRGLQQRLRTGPVGLSLSHRVNNAFRQQEAAIINRPGTDVSPCSGTGEGVVDFVLTPRYPPKWQKTLHISVFNVKSINMPLQCLQMAKDFAHFCFQCQKYDYATTSVL